MKLNIRLISIFNRNPSTQLIGKMVHIWPSIQLDLTGSGRSCLVVARDSLPAAALDNVVNDTTSFIYDRRLLYVIV